MAVRLVIGRAGSGKTQRCLDSIVADLRAWPLGPPIYWIVPKQATFITERELTCAMAKPAGGGGFCRVSILSFERLGEQILAECGGAAVPEVTALGRQMILGHLLRSNASKLRFFAPAARQPGLAAQLDATFGEFERCGRTIGDLAALLDDLERIIGPSADETNRRARNVASEVQALYDKVHDLKLIYQAYTAYAGQERLDRHRRLEQVLACIEQSRRFAHAKVYVDGFTRFTDYERRVLAQLGKVCPSVEITLLMDPASPLLHDFNRNSEDLALFHEVEGTYRQLRAALAAANAPVEEPIILREIERFEPGSLQELEAQFHKRLTACPNDGAAAIEMIEAGDRRQEADAVARRIRALWGDGIRLRDIAVLTRDIEAYHEVIAASFREHDIPCFVDRRRAVGHHPLLQFLRSALQIAQQGWPHASVMTLLKSGLAGLSDHQVDAMENYVLEHRIRGEPGWVTPEPWSYTRRVLGPEDEVVVETVHPSQINTTREKLLRGIGPFLREMSASGQTIRKLVLAVFALFERFEIPEALTRWMQEAHERGDFEQREEHAQVWSELADLLDQMVDLLGDEPATLDDFIEVLEAALNQFELALTPPTLDQVLVGQVDRTRTPRVTVAFIMGLNEGVFPRVPREDTVLSDAERRELRQRKLDIDPDTQRRLLDENLLAYVALTRASQRLVVTRCLSDDAGRPAGPSRYWHRLLELFPKLAGRIQNTDVGAGDALGRIGTARQLVSTLMKWVRNLGPGAVNQHASGDEVPALPALYQWLATHPPLNDAIDVARYRSWRALGYQNQAKLSKQIVQELFGADLESSVTRIEAFAACPFKHFARYGLQLEQRREEDEVTPLDLGNVIHGVLEKIVRTMLDRKTGWEQIAAADQEKLICELVQEVGQELRGEVLLSGGRNGYILGRIERTVRQVMAAQQAAASRGRFSPAYAELTFGGVSGALPALELSTPRKRTLRLRGKIDRVDVAADQGAVAVVDYKLRGSLLALDRVYHGLSLQLITYLLVLRENAAKLRGKPLSPAAAFYIKLLRTLDDVKHPSEAAGGIPDLRVKPRGIIHEDYLGAVDASLTSGGSDVVSAHIKADGTCGNKSRTDTATAEEFEALLEHVRQTLCWLADSMMDGTIDIRPFLMRHASPCPSCEFFAICRFDPAVNRYQVLEPMKREQVLERAAEEARP